jgi:hypothetical protein
VGAPKRIVLEGPKAVSLGLLGLAYAVLASFTHPFTWAANAVTAVPLVAAVAVALWWARRHDRTDHGATADGAEGGRPKRGAAWALWSTPVLAVIGWELYCFVNLPRSMHPTVSSLLDMLDSTRGGKIVAFAAWLALGWFLVSS